MDVTDNAATIRVYLLGEEPRINLKLIAGLLGFGVVGLVIGRGFKSQKVIGSR